MRAILILAAAAAALVTAQSASAQSLTAQAEPASRAVSTAKVDFRDQASVRHFYARLRTAAVEACDAQSLDRGPAVSRDPGCATATLAATVQQLNRPLLTAEFQQHDGVRFAARGY